MSEQTQSEQVREPVGDLGQEAARLLAEAQKWWRGANEAQAEHVSTECSICPICQLLARVRTARPDLVEHLAAAATSLFSALKVTFDTGEGGWAGRDDAPTVERIDIR